MISLRELLDIAAMTAAVAFIFADFLIPHAQKGPFRVPIAKHWSWKAFAVAAAITAPALIAHELAHKFTALALGIPATFHALYFWLAFGIFLRLIHSPIIFLIPGGVALQAKIGPAQTLAIAAAGPALNLLLGLAALAILKLRPDLPKLTTAILHFTKYLNFFWFGLNMLPIPPTDGYKIYSALAEIFFKFRI